MCFLSGCLDEGQKGQREVAAFKLLEKEAIQSGGTGTMARGNVYFLVALAGTHALWTGLKACWLPCSLTVDLKLM